MHSYLRPDRIYPGYVFDLDGTLYLSDRALPGAARLIEGLKRAGSRIVYVSNNPTVRRPEMAARLTRLGIPTQEGEVVNSTLVTVHYLSETAPGCRVFPVGEAPLEEELARNGFELCRDPARIDFVVASFDRTFAYWKLQTAFDALRAGARFIATNADRFCPVEGGGEPDAACVIAAIEACTQKPVEVVLGKPSNYMAETALARLGLDPAECLLAGDRLETDILMGAQAGMHTALALTGASRVEGIAAAPARPEFVLERIDHLLPG